MSAPPPSKTGCLQLGTKELTAVGFEPTPFRNGALSHRLRPLGQTVIVACKPVTQTSLPSATSATRVSPYHAPTGLAADVLGCWTARVRRSISAGGSREQRPACKPGQHAGCLEKQLDTLGFEPRAFRMRSGCDATTPCALCPARTCHRHRTFPTSLASAGALLEGAVYFSADISAIL